MNRRSLEKLRTDRRLAGRSGWLSKAELAEEAEALPDAIEKIAEVEAEPEAGEREAAPIEANASVAADFDRLQAPDTA